MTRLTANPCSGFFGEHAIVVTGGTPVFQLHYRARQSRISFKPHGRPPTQEHRLRLNGHRALCVVALSVATCEHGTLKSRNFTALFSWTPGLSVGDQAIHSKSDFLVAKGNCATAVDRSRGANGRRISARRSLFRSLNRAMETSAKMKFLLNQIEDVGVRCGPAIDFI
jgi:hypothetical protein